MPGQVKVFNTEGMETSPGQFLSHRDGGKNGNPHIIEKTLND
jgi:hypothetical protein